VCVEALHGRLIFLNSPVMYSLVYKRMLVDDEYSDYRKECEPAGNSKKCIKEILVS
jgi:hypothetical protein